MRQESSFHQGERMAQQMAGETGRALANGAVIGDRIMHGALGLVRSGAMAVVSSRAKTSERWCSLVFGAPGFLQPSSDRRALTLAIDGKLNDMTDPLWDGVNSDPLIGVLIIDLESRRRLRINGRAERTREGLLLHIDQSYANCPKYIGAKRLEAHRVAAAGGQQVPHRTGLSPNALAAIGATDILFLATGHPERGADVSHRGGKPGFVAITGPNTLRMPDYCGNAMFNSIGNLLVDPHFGLVVPDFRRGQAWQLTGTAEVRWPDKAHAEADPRVLDFEVQQWRESPLPLREAAGPSRTRLARTEISQLLFRIRRRLFALSRR
jgi:uncharacterized protein